MLALAALNQPGTTLQLPASQPCNRCNQYLPFAAVEAAAPPGVATGGVAAATTAALPAIPPAPACSCSQGDATQTKHGIPHETLSATNAVGRCSAAAVHRQHCGS